MSSDSQKIRQLRKYLSKERQKAINFQFVQSNASKDKLQLMNKNNQSNLKKSTNNQSKQKKPKELIATRFQIGHQLNSKSMINSQNINIILLNKSSGDNISEISSISNKHSTNKDTFQQKQQRNLQKFQRKCKKNFKIIQQSAYNCHNSMQIKKFNEQIKYSIQQKQELRRLNNQIQKKNQFIKQKKNLIQNIRKNRTKILQQTQIINKQIQRKRLFLKKYETMPNELTQLQQLFKEKIENKAQKIAGIQEQNKKNKQKSLNFFINSCKDRLELGIVQQQIQVVKIKGLAQCRITYLKHYKSADLYTYVQLMTTIYLYIRTLTLKKPYIMLKKVTYCSPLAFQQSYYYYQQYCKIIDQLLCLWKNSISNRTVSNQQQQNKNIQISAYFRKQNQQFKIINIECQQFLSQTVNDILRCLQLSTQISNQSIQLYSNTKDIISITNIETLQNYKLIILKKQ